MSTKPRVVSVGEVLWDLLPTGPQLGGAPANFACHVRALGANSTLVSRVGDDALGREAVRLLTARGLDLEGLTVDPSRPTGTVSVEVAADGQPRFQIHEDVAWDALEADPATLDWIAAADAVCFGSLGQRSPAAGEVVRRCVAAALPDALRIFDINLRAPFFSAAVVERSLELANVLKLNETELPVLASQFGLAGSAEEQLGDLARRFDLDVVALTLGASGSRLLRDGRWTFEPGRVVSVRDAVGAGDSYTAALVMGLLRDWPTERLLKSATDIAAFVCTQSGATPDLPAELVAAFLDDDRGARPPRA